jgi:uncharacterized protein (DUF1778 family)
MAVAAIATTIRIPDDYTRRVIDYAANLVNQTRTAFLLNSARKEAERVIEERSQTETEVSQLINLSQAATLDMLKKMDNPPKPTTAMKGLMAEYKAAAIPHKYGW